MQKPVGQLTNFAIGAMYLVITGAFLYVWGWVLLVDPKSPEKQGPQAILMVIPFVLGFVAIPRFGVGAVMYFWCWWTGAEPDTRL